MSEKYYLSDKMLKYLSTAKRAIPNINEETEKARTLIASYYKTQQMGNIFGAMYVVGSRDINQQNRIYDINRISPCNGSNELWNSCYFRFKRGSKYSR